MDREYGALKAEAWRISGKLNSRPDTVTGSSEPHMIEFACPEDIDSSLHGDTVSYAVKATRDADETDLDKLGGTTPATADVKKEAADPKAILAQRVEELKVDPKPTLRRFQDYELEAKLLQERATGQKYTEGMLADNTKFLVKLTKTIKILNLLATKGANNTDELQKLITTIDNLDVEYKDIIEWGSRFGFCSDPKKVSRKRKAT